MSSFESKPSNTPLIWWPKFLSSNWWWYGEVNPDPTKLPPPEKRPKLWRTDAILVVGFVPVITFLSGFSAELNSRYWPFNQNQTYEGVILTTQNSDRQLLVQSNDTTRIETGFPIADTWGIYPQVSRTRPRFWEPTMKKLIEGHYQCPGRRLKIYGEPWKFTFRPVIRIWRVDCADINVTLVDQETIEHRWRSYMNGNHIFLSGVSLGFSFFFLSLIVHRERKLYFRGQTHFPAKA